MIRWRTRFFGPLAASARLSIDPEKSGAWPLWIIAAAAMFAFAAYAGPVLIPLVAALVLYYMFAPLKRRLVRRGIGTLPIAIGVPLLLVALLLAGFSMLAAPVSGWIEKAPEMVFRLQSQLSGMMSPVDKMREAGEQVKKMTDGSAPGTTEVSVKSRGLVERVFGGLSDMVVNIGAALMLLFYLLLRRAPPERAFIGFIKTFGVRRRAFRAVREAEADLSRYIGTITLINMALGVLLAVSFHLVGLPGAAVLGATIAVLNYIPLLGALASFVLTLVAGLASFDTFGQAIVPPLIAAAFHTIETNFVTPAILGRRLTLDPFLVVLSLLFGAWLWGIGGAVLAVPLLLFSVAAWRAYICYDADRKKEQSLAGPPPATLAPPLGAAGE